MVGAKGPPRVRFSHSLLQLPVRFDAEALAAEVSALPPSAWVPHPMGFPGNDAVPLVTVGGGLNDEFTGAMAATEHLKKLPYVTHLMEELGGVWGRSRLMGLGAGAIVPRHVDIHYYWRTHIRIHIPVTTNPGVRFHCGGEDVHMQPGEAWVFDSFRLHEVRNDGQEKRVHLVLDTVGSSRIWELIEAANAGGEIPDHPWHPGDLQNRSRLRFEQRNQPVVMTPWEMRCHVDYIFENLAAPAPAEISKAIDRFIFTWQAAWTEHGDGEPASPAYKALIQSVRKELVELGTGQVPLNNEASLYRALDALVFSRALQVPTAARAAASPKAA
jgi:hypothetical protein